VALAQQAAYAVVESLPEPLARALQGLGAALSEHFQRQPLAVGPLLAFHFALQRFVKLADSLGEHSLFEVQQDPSTAADGVAALDTAAQAHALGEPSVTFTLRNVVPARFLRQRLKALHSVTLFSATLGPHRYAIDLLGLPEDTAWLDVPPVFPPENLRVRVARTVSTRYAHRTQSLDSLVDVIERQFDAHVGNYLAFFSSFEYLQRAAGRLALRRPDIPQWQQAPASDAAARQDFLQRFTVGGRGLGFAVLGGIFAEGVDLPGSRLIGAFIATLGLPPVSPVQLQVQARLARTFGADAGYADLVPAMQKVVQAAGRVLRTPQDRGWLWLLDDRYAQPGVARLLPPWWGLSDPGEQAARAA
jgi:Rad3-related DNA helicase